MHCHTLARQLGGLGVRPRSRSLPEERCLGAVCSGTHVMHCHTARGQWAVELVVVQLLQCTATLPAGSGQCNSCNALPHCLGAVGSGTPVMHCHTPQGQWAAELLQRTPSLPRGSRQ